MEFSIGLKLPQANTRTDVQINAAQCAHIFIMGVEVLTLLL